MASTAGICGSREEEVVEEAARRGEPPPPRLLYTGEELREMRKLQAVASVERDELNNSRGRNRD